MSSEFRKKQKYEKSDPYKEFASDREENLKRVTKILGASVFKKQSGKSPLMRVFNHLHLRTDKEGKFTWFNTPGV